MVPAVPGASTDYYVANMGTIPLLLWSVRLASLDQPDWMSLDLDPEGAPFTDVVQVARALYRICDGRPRGRTLGRGGP